MGDVAWIAVDWGTSHLRAWLMARDGTFAAMAKRQLL